MNILFDDFVQYSNSPSSLRSASLAETTKFLSLTVDLGSVRTFDCIGVGNTTATTINVNGVNVALSAVDKNGLYLLPAPITSSTLILTFPAENTVGRVAVGVARQLYAAPAREPSFWSTATSRRTLSGQVVPGAGGVSGRKISLDFRYKFTREIVDDIQRAFPSQLGRGYPLFLSFTHPSELNRFPWERLYATTDNAWLFQSSVNKFLYSIKLDFTEAY